MSRSHPPLQQHLLTRSDLARLGVPAGDILAWLARGAIEQVGTLAGDGGDDPVFTAAPELRAELSTRLASIGKSAVVMSPLRVRSFLLRALMNRPASAETTTAEVEPNPTALSPSEALAEHLATTDLAQVLHEAATELEADVEHVLRIAEEEARLEASVGVAAADAVPAPAESGNGEFADAEPKDTEPSAELADGDEADEDEACFDVDDLASALGEWDEDPATTEVDPPVVAADDNGADNGDGEGNDGEGEKAESETTVAAAIPTAKALDQAAAIAGLPPEDHADVAPSVSTEREPAACADHRPFAGDPGQEPAEDPTADADLAEPAAVVNNQPATESHAHDAADERSTPASTDITVDAPGPRDAAPAAPSVATSSQAPECEPPVLAANQELPAATAPPEALAGPEPAVAVRGDEADAMPAVEATTELAPEVMPVPSVDHGAPTDEPEVATASTAAPTCEEPTMSAEPMVTEHEDHSAAGAAADGTTQEPGHAFEPGMQAEDAPPTFDADEIAAALSVLDLDVGPAKGKAASSGDDATPPAAAAVPPKVEVAVADTATVHPAEHATDDEAELAERAATQASVAVEAGAEAAPAGTPAEPGSAVAGNPGAVQEEAQEVQAVEADTPPAAPTPEAAAATAAHASSPSASSLPKASTTSTTNAGRAASDADGAPLLAASMQRVESFLGELKAALVEMAGRPAGAPPPPSVQIPTPAPVDLAPLVGAIEGGLKQSAATSAATASALSGLAEKLDGIGQRLERSAIATESVAQHAKAPKSDVEPARFLVARSNPVPLALLAVAALVTAWSVLFWFKTGSPRLALGTLIGANLVGCVMLAPGRFR